MRLKGNLLEFRFMQVIEEDNKESQETADA